MHLLSAIALIRSAHHPQKRQMYLNYSHNKRLEAQSGTLQDWLFSYLRSSWTSVIYTVSTYAVILVCCGVLWLLTADAASARPVVTPSSTLSADILSSTPDNRPILIAQADQVIEGKPVPDSDPSFDLDQAADKAEEASKQVFQGLEGTQQLYGKDQQPVNDVIEDARQHASDKWQNLADKARASEKDNDVSLTPSEQHILKRFVNRQTQEDAVHPSRSNAS